MKTKPLVIHTFILILIILLISSVLATNAKTKTGKMILRDIPLNEEVEKFIWVINDNEFPVEISFVMSGDLKENIIFKEEIFSLLPGEEKKAYFMIKATEPGTTTTKVTSVFTPASENGSAVGITSTVILITKESKTLAQSEQSHEESNTNSDSNSQKIILIISSIILLAVLLFFYFNKKPKKTTKKRKRGLTSKHG